jgi:hypothetical protein
LRNLKRNLLLAGAGVAMFLVVGAAVISPRDDGDYHLQIYKDGDIYKLRGKPGNNPAEPYRLTRQGRIDWTFTNATDNDTLRVWIANMTCDGNPTIDCPLKFDSPSGSCASIEVPLKKGEMQAIGADDMGGRCEQAMGPDLWEYKIMVRTTTPPTIGDADPQLIIIRDRLTRFLESFKSMLRSVKRVLHL